MACGSKTETQIAEPLPVVQEEVVVTGPQMSKPWSFAQELTSNGNRFEISLERQADSTLQIVRDADGVEYLDNKIQLRVVVDGAEKMNRAFTKHTFESYMKSEDAQHCILHGMAFDQMEDGILLFGAQVGSPEEDVNYYFLVKVDKDGGIAITRDYQSDTSPVH